MDTKSILSEMAVTVHPNNQIMPFPLYIKPIQAQQTSRQCFAYQKVNTAFESVRSNKL